MRMKTIRIALLACAAALVAVSGRAQEVAELPKVVLVGDSIRLGYAPVVAEKLRGKVQIISPQGNGGDSNNVLKVLDQWVIREQPQLVHLNCGLHDLKLDKQTKQHQVSLERYEKNLREIVSRIRQNTKAVLVFAKTTPILDDRHAQRRATFDRCEADVQRYNQVADRVMKELNVPVNDLHDVVVRGGPEKLLVRDGTHYSPEANQILAEAVSGTILRHLKLK